MDIRDVREYVGEMIKDEVLYVATEYPVEQIAESLTLLSDLFAALGICDLLHAGLPANFQANLARSGHVRRYVLQQAQREGVSGSRYQAASFSDAFLHSVAGNHLALAREIAALSPDDWTPNGEYEDDFCYHRFLQLVVAQPDPLDSDRLQALLNRFEHVLEGQGAVRLDLCQALLDRSDEELEEHLLSLLAEKEEADNGKRPAMVEPDVRTILFWPSSFVSLEALALIRIAELVGLRVSEGIPLCPEMARDLPEDPQVDDSIREIAAAR